MKTVSLEDSVAMIPDGASLMIGGFMGVGTPERMVDELARQGKRGLTVIANDTATPGRGIGKLVTAGAVRKAIVSHIGLNPETQQKMIALRTAPAVTSLPMPRPGVAVSFAITVSSRLPWRASSSTTRCGVPTPMKPPIMRLAPSGIMATESSRLTVFMPPPSLLPCARLLSYGARSSTPRWSESPRPRPCCPPC